MGKAMNWLTRSVTELEIDDATAVPKTQEDATAPAGVPWSDNRVQDILGEAAAPANLEQRAGLIFAMDATASRSPTWAKALKVQAAMFSAFAPGLKVQLVYFRGQEFKASEWSWRAEDLARAMRDVTCLTGGTQIARVLTHSFAMAEQGRVSALVYVGDCMEEAREELAGLARKLGARGVKAFMFQEGDDPAATTSFREIAALTGGAYCKLGAHSAAQLKELLSAAAAYAAGGKEGLARLAKEQPAARLLLAQLK
jgi:hypothetical protein